MKLRLVELTWEDVKEYLKKKDILIVPCGAIEQHGPMAPIGTDIIIADEISRRIAERANILIGPTITFGYVDPEFKKFPGTLCINLKTFCALLRDYLVSFSEQGFKKFIIVNTHEDNKKLIEEISKKVSLEYGIKVISFEYWNLLEEEYKEFIESDLIHACEDEISILLSISPSLVKKDKIIDEMPPKLKYFVYPLPPECVTISGVKGKPTLAKKEKGEKILRLIVEKAINIIKKEFGKNATTAIKRQ